MRNNVFHKKVAGLRKLGEDSLGENRLLFVYIEPIN